VTRILFVDDELDVLAGLRRMVRSSRPDWSTTFALGAEEALDMLAQGCATGERHDVVVTDMRMPVVDGAELLAVVRRRHPDMVRIVLSGQTDESSAVRSLPVAHRFLSKPCEPTRLVAAIESTLQVRSELNDPEIRDIVGSLNALPSPRASLRQLQELLMAAPIDVDAVCRLIGDDLGLSAKLLQVVNSAFYGLSRVVDDAVEATRLVGPAAVGEVLLASELLASLADRSPNDDHALQRLHALARCRADFAHQLAVTAGRSTSESRRIWTDAFFCDVGLLLFVDDPTRVHLDLQRLAGGALLAMWGVPHHVVEAAVLSGREPCTDASDGHRFTWLAARLLADPGEDRGRSATGDAGRPTSTTRSRSIEVINNAMAATEGLRISFGEACALSAQHRQRSDSVTA
jgi:HD-like signal output (HDOD) protein/CheY-like chemotaxis protein